MEVKNDIGSAIKERLELYKDSPDNLVWDHIEKKLIEKNRRRRIIFWIFGFGFGIALLSLFIINSASNYKIINAKETETPVMSYPENSVTTNNSNEVNSNKNENSEKDRKESYIIEDESNTNVKKNMNTSNAPENNKTSPIHKSHSTTNNSLYNNSTNTKNKLVNTTLNTSQKNENIINKKNIIANLNSKTTDKNVINNLLTKSVNNDINVSQIKLIDTLASEFEKLLNRRKDSSYSNQINDLLKTNEVSNDSLYKNTLLKDPLTEEKTNDSLRNNNNNRWSISPIFSPTYYGLFNEKTTDNVSINYGLLVGYDLNRTLHLRTGIRKLNLNHTISKDSLSTRHKVDYIEFPLELKYTPKKNKFNPYVTGGFSYFMLQDASLNNQNNSDYNSTFSINAGVGVEYKLFKKIYLNLEPNFIYQFNPISQNSDLNPFILTLNFGLTYRF